MAPIDSDNNGTDQTIETESTAPEPTMPAIPLIHLPRSAEELLPPRQADLLTQVTEMLRTNFDDCLDLLQGISGEVPPVHGSGVANEWALVFQFKKKCADNGHIGLSHLNAAQLRTKIRTALKRVTGISFRKLEQQGVRLRLELRRALTHQQAAE